MRHLHLSALLVALATITFAVGCSGNQGTPQGYNAGQGRSRMTTSTTATESVPLPNASNTYRVKLTELNNSGVSGDATVTVHGTSITVTVNAANVESGEKHPMHIHGFRDRSRSTLPSGTAEIDDQQAEMAIGPPLLALEPYPDVDTSGRITFTASFDNVQMLFPLERRGLEIHGLTRDRKYDFTLPVAAGLLRPVTGSGGRGSLGGSGSLESSGSIGGGIDGGAGGGTGGGTGGTGGSTNGGTNGGIGGGSSTPSSGAPGSLPQTTSP